MSEGEGGFLGRWSRRKLEARNEPPEKPAVDTKPEAAPVLENGTAAVPAKAADVSAPSGVADPSRSEDAEAEFDPTKLARPLPTLEDIVPGMDMTPFFQTGVPERIRNAALRKLWITDPAIRDFENPAREYAYDWNVPGGVPGSGELVGDHDAVELLRRLTGGSDPEEEKTADEMTQIDAEAAADPASDDFAVAKDDEQEAIGEEPEALQDKASAVAAPAKDEDEKGLKDAVSGSGRRRHGGAMPG